MTNQAVALSPYAQDSLPRESESVAQTRSKFLQLQALVTIVLSYQMLFGSQVHVLADVQMAVILGLLLTCVTVMVIPPGWIEAGWFPGILALGDTAITTGLIYVSGNASSDLYLTYFVIIFIATMTRTLKQLFLFLSLVCTFYGFTLYQEIHTTGELHEHHLLRIPLFLVMAIFYGRTVEAARTLAEKDSLTGLPNRRKFVTIVSKAMARARNTGEHLALLFMNLDGFKLINDTLGRRAGDELLKAVAARLVEGPANGHSLGREGSDEFTLLMEPCRSPQASVDLAQEVLRSMAPPFPHGDREIFLTASIGIAQFPKDATNAENLLSTADTAMSRAKEQGKNGFQLYSPDMEAQAHQKLELKQNLRKALDRKEFRVYFQPQVELSSGHIVGLEALARWYHPKRGLISPAEFIPAAEDTGLIVPIGTWILQEACSQVQTWHRQGGSLVRVSINLSARQLIQEDLVTLVGQTLRHTQLDPAFLEIEMTESLLMQDTDKTIHTLQALKALGIRLSIDDFGTGYSSLSYLKRFPIDTIKIDQSFVRDVTSNSDSKAIVKAIIGMAQALKLRVIAEGVEHEEQAALLRDEGCHECQGFLYSPALPAENMERVLREWPARPFSAV